MTRTEGATESEPSSWREQLARVGLPLTTAAFLLILLYLGLSLRLTRDATDAAPIASGAESSAAVAAAPPDARPSSSPAETVAAGNADAGAADASTGPATNGAPIAEGAPSAAAWLDGLAVGEAPLWRAGFTGSINDTLWTPIAGDWSFRDNALVQSDTTRFDLSTLYNQPFADYVYAVDLRHLDGVGAGVLFNVPQLGTVNGGHLIRFTDDNTGIFWGYFDAAGVFNGQGYAPTGAPGTAPHTLEIASRGDTYAVRLDGTMLAANVPLSSRAGFPGLTTSRSSAAFGNINIYPLTEAAAAQPGLFPGATMVLTGTGLLTDTSPLTGTGLVTASASLTDATQLELDTITGEWVQDERGVIRQLSTLATDYSMGTGMAAESYRLDATIELPADPELADAGGGMIFHMPDREVVRGAHLVRLVNGGTGITWGYFDETGAYVGQGYADLAGNDARIHRLSLTVDRDRFDVTVDDVLLVDNMRTQRDSGWIGLLSYRGPVIFRDMQLTLGNVIQ